MPFVSVITYICEMNLIRTLIVGSLVLLFFFSACKKDEILTDSSAKLEFSTDSVMFDTVFTTVGSTTKTFRIYNKHDQPLNISSISLGGGSSSVFRINVDGVAGTSITNTEILPGDSLFVFVQVTVDPTGVNSPLLIKDSIIFQTNGNLQYVNLTAIGQDVYLHKPDHFPTNGLPPYSIITCNDVWTNDKPHLIFGYAVVDSGCTLTMMPGTRVSLHKGAVLWIYQDGTLKILGNHGSEVVIQGDRLEPEYKEVPGQWGKIWMMKGSKNNVVDWAIIKNGGIGIQVDSINTAGSPSLKLSNTIIRNMQAAALYGQGAHIWSANCVFANCGQYVAALALGGKYKFEHCTFANFWTGNSGSTVTSRTTPLLLMNNYYVDVTNTLHLRSMDSCYFGNCILYGDLDEEIGMDTTNLAAGTFYYKFDYSLLKTSRGVPDGYHYNHCYRNVSPGFKDAANRDFQLISTSTNSINMGNPAILVPFDLNGQLRDAFPDLGAYEFIP